VIFKAGYQTSLDSLQAIRIRHRQAEISNTIFTM